MKKSLNLKWKFIIYLLLFTIGILCLIFSFQVLFLQDFYTNTKVNDLSTVSKNISSRLKIENKEEFLDFLSQQARDYDVCVRVIHTTDDGSKSYAVDDLKACNLTKLSTTDIFEILAQTYNNNGSLLIEETAENVVPNLLQVQNATTRVKSSTKSLMFSKLYYGNDYSSLVLVSTFVAPVNATVVTLRQQFIYIVLIVVTAAIILALIISRTVVDPIQKIMKNARKLPNGDYSDNDIKGEYSEIIELNQTLIDANTKIKVADQAKRDLIANVSHDLRTPLTMISGYGEMMRDLPGENNVENAQVIIDEAKRLSILVNDLIDLSSMQDNAMQLNLQIISIHQLLKDVYHQYARFVENKGFVFELDLSNDCNVSCDVNRIKQVLYNFISNAINHSKDEKTIIIRQSIKDNLCRIAVIDKGEGITEDKLADIWDRYYKIGANHKRSNFGSGLGLAITKEILDLHNLNYGVTSKINEGSTFYFDLIKINE